MYNTHIHVHYVFCTILRRVCITVFYVHTCMYVHVHVRTCTCMCNTHKLFYL